MERSYHPSGWGNKGKRLGLLKFKGWEEESCQARIPTAVWVCCSAGMKSLSSEEGGVTFVWGGDGLANWGVCLWAGIIRLVLESWGIWKVESIAGPARMQEPGWEDAARNRKERENQWWLARASPFSLLQLCRLPRAPRFQSQSSNHLEEQKCGFPSLSTTEY